MVEKYLVSLGDVAREVEVVKEGDCLLARMEAGRHHLRLEALGPPGHFRLLVDNRAYEVLAERHNGGFNLLIGARLYAVTLETEKARRRSYARGFPLSAGGANGTVVSPMMGAVVKVIVQPGQQVEVGDVLLIIEAMKMHNEIRAQQTGTVEAVYVQPGQRVPQGTTLLVLR